MVKRKVELSFEATGADKVSNAISKIGRAAKQTSTAAKGLEKAGGGLTNSFKGFRQNLLLLPTALASSIGLIKGLARAAKSLTVDLIVEGGAIADTAGQFERLQKAGVDTVQVLASLRRATQGQVKDVQLQRLALSALGGDSQITQQQFAKLTEAIFVTSKGLGRDFRPALEQLRRALATGSLTSLAAVEGFEGITASLVEAREAARTSGTRFTKLDQLNVGLAAALKIADKQLDRFGGTADSAGDDFARVTTTIGNFFDQLKFGIVSSIDLQDALKELGAIFGIVGGESGKAGESIGKTIGNAFAFLVKAAIDFGKAFATVGSIVLKIIAGITFGFGKLVSFVANALAGLRLAIGLAFAGLVKVVLFPLELVFLALEQIEAITGLIPDAFAKDITAARVFIQGLSTDIAGTSRESARALELLGEDAEKSLDKISFSLLSTAQDLDKFVERANGARRRIAQQRIEQPEIKIKIEDSPADIRTRVQGVLGPVVEALVRTLEERRRQEQELLEAGAAAVAGAL